MTYQKYYPGGWQSGPSGGTPITPEALNHMENGIVNSLHVKESADYPGCYFRDVSGETEWINPPMALGVEYRTSKRWMGRPVYVKALNFGALPNASEKTLTHNPGTTDYGLISYAVITSNRRVIVGTGYDDIISRESPIITFAGPYTIRIKNSINMSAYSAIVWIEYVKY